MDCKMIEDDLVAFHFGSLEESRRAAVENHLCGCADCLRGFLALKRAVETGLRAGSDGPRPSANARARLREAVAREFATPAVPPKKRRVRPFQALAAAAVVALALAGLYQWRHTAPTETAAPVESIDSARAVAANLQFL